MAIGCLKRAGFFRDPRARVAVHREPQQSPIKRHRHEFVEVVLVIKGSALHVAGAFRHRIGAGDILVIGTESSHRYEETRELSIVNILFRVELLPRLKRDLGLLPGFHALFASKGGGKRPAWMRLQPSDFTMVGTWLDELDLETQRGREGGNLLAEAYLTLIVGLLARRYAESETRAVRRPEQLGRVLAWIEENLEHSFTVNDLAEHASMSVRTLHRRFRDSTGKTPWDYVMDRRIDRARTLLAHDPEMRIQEASLAVGIEDSNYFSRLFHAKTGVTPRDWSGGGFRRAVSGKTPKTTRVH